MPELPEVETIRRGLRRKILNKKIIEVVLSAKAKVKGSQKRFLQILKKNKFNDVGRIGKLLVLKLADKNNFLLIHLKMTGQLVWVKELPPPLHPSSGKRGKQTIAGGHPVPEIGEEPNRFTRASLKFAGGGELFFNDIRRFGYLQLVDKAGLKKIQKQFGLEPLTSAFTLANFKRMLANKKMPIKTALMDQKLVSGLGNIYASEACFEAGIRPDRRTNTLNKEEIKKLFQACQKVIKIAIKNRGTTFHDYLDADGRTGYHARFLKVYDREGELCKRCKKGRIARKQLGGRGTYFCPKCQR